MKNKERKVTVANLFSHHKQSAAASFACFVMFTKWSVFVGVCLCGTAPNSRKISFKTPQSKTLSQI